MKPFSVIIIVFPDRVRIAAAYYIGPEKRYSFPMFFFIVAIFTASCMVASEIVARMRRTNRTSPAQANNTNSQNKHTTNMVIANLIPFTTLNLAFAFGFVVNAFIKALNTTQMGAPKLSIHMNVMLLMLVLSNSNARNHFKRKIAIWRGLDLVEVIDLQQQITTHR